MQSNIMGTLRDAVPLTDVQIGTAGLALVGVLSVWFLSEYGTAIREQREGVQMSSRLTYTFGLMRTGAGLIALKVVAVVSAMAVFIDANSIATSVSELFFSLEPVLWAHTGFLVGLFSTGGTVGFALVGAGLGLVLALAVGEVTD